MKSTINIPYERYENSKEMSPADAELIAQARQATQHSYAPFSGFKVGAAARLKSGRIIIGANRESEVYPSGLCAE